MCARFLQRTLCSLEPLSTSENEGRLVRADINHQGVEKVGLPPMNPYEGAVGSTEIVVISLQLLYKGRVLVHLNMIQRIFF